MELQRLYNLLQKQVHDQQDPQRKAMVSFCSEV